MTLAARPLGRSGVALSPIAFGSMRLDERALDDDAWLALLRGAHDRGVTTLHSSTEYATFDRFCALVRRLDRPVQHIVKLADPHFGEDAFDAARFASRVAAYRERLGGARLDVVQWMWRGDLKDDPARCAGVRAQAAEIGAACAALRAAGAIGAVAPFPYTADFADAALDTGAFDGLTVYANPLEPESAPHVARAHELGLGAIALRPFAAGKALAGQSARACVAGVLAMPGVACAVASFSSLAHLDELI